MRYDDKLDTTPETPDGGRRGQEVVPGPEATEDPWPRPHPAPARTLQHHRAGGAFTLLPMHATQISHHLESIYFVDLCSRS